MDGYHRHHRVSFHTTNFSIVSFFHSGTPKEEDSMQYKDTTQPMDFREFKHDYEMLLRNKPSKRKFVFLIRNPIQRFIAGLLQDFVVKEQEQELWHDVSRKVRIKSSPNDIIYTEWFFNNNLHQEKFEDRIIERLKIFFEDDDCMFPTSKKEEGDDRNARPIKGPDNILYAFPGYMGGSHIRDFIYWIYGLSNTITDNKNLIIFDINIQRLHNTLWDWGYKWNNSGMKPGEEGERNDRRAHVKPRLLNLMIRYLIAKKPWGAMTNTIQDTNIQCYKWLIEKQYGPEDFDGGNRNIHSVDHYFEDCYIEGKGKTWKDLVDIDIHKGWCSEEELFFLENRIRTYNRNNPEFTSRKHFKEYDASEHLDGDRL
jgi:hypothetical protein